MNERLQLPEYSFVHTRDAFQTKQELSDEVRRIADDLEQSIASNPGEYANRSVPIGLDGQVLVYSDPDSPLEVTYQVDEGLKRIVFFRYGERYLRLRYTIFISYSHKDSLWRKQLSEVFSALEHLGEISFWDDQRLKAGTPFRDQIEHQLDAANAAILLVSDFFLDSKFIREVELPRILREKGMKVYWIHLSKSRVRTLAPEITKFHSLSTNPEITLSDLVDRGDDLQEELMRMQEALAEAIGPN